jgi:hypothetical protein
MQVFNLPQALCVYYDLDQSYSEVFSLFPKRDKEVLQGGDSVQSPASFLWRKWGVGKTTYIVSAHFHFFLLVFFIANLS